MVSPAYRGAQRLEWARCGVARAGASPSNFYNQFITLYVAGADKTDDLAKNSLQIEDILTSQPNTCKFQIYDTKPDAGTEVLISNGVADCSSNRIFGGLVLETKLKRIQAGAKVLYEVNCIDFTRLLDRRLVSMSYYNTSADDIFEDIIHNYCGASIQSAGVQGGAPIIEKIQFNFVTVSKAFKQICKETGWEWYIDYHKNVHFFDPVNEPTMRNITDSNYDFNNLEITEDCSQVINRVIIEGKDAEEINLLDNPGFHEGTFGNLPDYWQKCYDGDGGSTFKRRSGGYDDAGGKGELILGGTDTLMSGRQIISPEGELTAGQYYRFAIYLILNYSASGTLRITEQTGGSSYYTEATWELQGDEGEYTEWWVEHYIHDAANTELVVDVYHSSSNILNIDKARLWALNKAIVENVNSQAIFADLEGGDGIYEYFKKDTSLETYEHCEAKAKALLEIYKNINYRGRYDTHDYNVRTGQIINIDLTKPSIDHNFLIRKVSISTGAPGYMWKLQKKIELASIRRDIVDIMNDILEEVGA